MNWEEALDAMGEGNIVKLPDKPSGLRVEMGIYIEVWEDGRENVLSADIAPIHKKSDEWEIAEWSIAD